MKIDTQSGAAYLKLSDAPVARTVEVSAHIMCDIDAEGSLCGVEFIDYSPSQWAQLQAALAHQNV